MVVLPFPSGLFYFVVCSSRSPVDTVGHYGGGGGGGGSGIALSEEDPPFLDKSDSPFKSPILKPLSKSLNFPGWAHKQPLF